MEPGVQPARFIPELSLSASSVEQAKVGDRAAHTPTHGLYLQGETHGDSRSNRGTCLLIAFCGHALQSSKVRVRPISVILVLAVEILLYFLFIKMKVYYVPLC